MIPEVRKRINENVLVPIRNIFWAGTSGEVRFTKVSLKKLINGNVYYSITAFPKGKEMNFLEVVLFHKGKSMQIVMFSFKGKMSQ